MNLTGHTALITGAGQGIGRACAEVFAERGARLVLLDKNKRTLPRVAQALTGKGCNVIAHVIDLTRTRSLEVLIEKITREVAIDILINNAGFDKPGVTSKVHKNHFDAVLGIHVGVPFMLIKLLLPDMRARKWGRIVNISSVYGLSGAKGEVAYSTAKAGDYRIDKDRGAGRGAGRRNRERGSARAHSDPHHRKDARKIQDSDNRANASLEGSVKRKKWHG